MALRDFCARLKELHVQAGGPNVDAMTSDVRFPLRRTQVYQVLGGTVRRPPSWEFVAAFVAACDRYARDHHRTVSVSTDLGWWSAEHNKLVIAVDRERRAAESAEDADRPVPEQLPPAVANFVGREAELRELSGRMEAAGTTGAPIVISAVVGAGGVGKTALAVRWAHQVRDLFPDGQLFVNLRGFDPGHVVAAADALAGFLVALGVPEAELPASADQRSAAFRTRAARRRLLVVLDNAADAEHVRPLLPGSGACVVVVTSRNSLSGLVSVDGANRLTLTPLGAGDAVALLRDLIGARVETEPAEAAVLAGQCCRIPLALRIAAELVASQPGVPLRSFVAELADVTRRLDLMDATDDPRSALRAVFSWSYRNLPPPVARAFRLVGLHPGTTVTAATLGVLAGAPQRVAQGWLDHLVRVSLAHASGGGHVAMHDLLRAYARSLGEEADSEEERRQALDRLVEHYVRTGAEAVRALFDEEPDGGDAESAQGWLDGERHNIILVAGFAATNGWPVAAGDLSSSLWRYFVVHAHFEQAMAIHTHALTAARTRGDLGAQGRALGNVGMAYWLAGRNDEALKQMNEALQIFTDLGDQTKVSTALGMLGTISEALTRYDDAAGYYRRSLELARPLGDRINEANALDNLGNIEERRGNYPAALDLHQQALDIFVAEGDRDREGIALLNFGGVRQRLGRHHEARERYTAAAALFRAIGDRSSIANALTGIAAATAALGAPAEALPLLHEALAACADVGDVPQQGATLATLATALATTGRLPEAAAAATKALEIARSSGDRHREAEALIALGQVALSAEHYAEAAEHFAVAADVAASTGERDEQARSLAGLGRTRHATGDRDGARRLWRDAHELAQQLGTPLAAEMAALLAEG
ncbi:ATP-binding protein [Actinoplanes sp. CA-142083]|uniref:ATP-binding protein n=1 Tax=Actinoplanes sp. CA-142083 TaxID=3239903 RepID=UPI003D8FFC77